MATPTERPLYPFKESPSQTAGPYVHIGMLPAAAGLKLRSQEKPWITGLKGETIVIEGTVYDGDREPVRDAVLEIWQADTKGKFDTGHAGFARTACDFKTGLYRFETVKPGRFAWRDGRIAVMHEGRISGFLERPQFTEHNVMLLAVGRPLEESVPENA